MSRPKCPGSKRPMAKFSEHHNDFVTTIGKCNGAILVLLDLSFDFDTIDHDNLLRWSCHSGLKLLCKLCRTSPPPAMGARFTVFWHAGHADPLDGWRCCSQKRVMSRPIQVRQL